MTSIRPSVRFDVFKRDDFTCVYCGRRPPDVTLEVDHLIPRAEEGTDDPENLVTSCWDCNRGKGAVPLTTPPASLPDLDEKADLIRERERQLRAYEEVMSERRERREANFTEVWNYWFKVWNETELARWETPWESTLRKYLDLIGTAEVMEAMDITAGRFDYVSSKVVRYFVGVLKHKHADLEGRLVKCIYCGEWITLQPGDDPSHDWWHSRCAPEEASG